MIAGPGGTSKNNVIARDLKVETQEFVRMLARRTFNRADAGPYISLHNLAPQYDRPTKGYQLLLSKSSNEKKCSSWEDARVRAIGSYAHLHPQQGVEDSRTNAHAQEMQRA
ncbi:hypothetical protein EVAR_58945_1 [Eumeta japonica]|uniref:Uncharacterized protein n=1 Tax=Eumeta variegata TaxID=151549 RepID=A0A4C1YJ72_EUMVA|nr:hypothetical protein EVAR_58945_1 [Eumeta japonica]